MPIYFLWGDEDFLIERTVKKIKEEVLKGEINELNYRKVDSPDFPLFYETVKTNAMILGDIVIVVKCQNYFLTSKNKKELSEKQTEELINAFKNVSPRVHLILICAVPRGEKKKPDSRKKLYKKIQKLAKIQEFPSYRDYEEYKLIPIIKKMADEIGIKISDSECSLLIQTTGSSLRDLSSQLEKLKLYAWPDTKITSSMIEKIAANYVNIFSAADLILKKDYKQALNIISDTIQKEHYLPSLALIQTMINNLVKTKILSLSMRPYDIAVKTGQNEFVVKKNLEKIKDTTLDELIRLKINLTKTEYMLKTGIIKEPLLGYELAFLSDETGEY